jgi:23S rRNA (adenine2503-C2)-methyltransferase
MQIIKVIGLSKSELTECISTLGIKPFHAKQIWSWIYIHGVRDFSKMTNISLATREKLAKHLVINRPKISSMHKSSDGTIKWLLKFDDCNEVETVYIPEENRGTLCISSQIGCTLTCKFCHTGTQMLVRNLSAEELVQQIMIARDHFNEWPSPQENRVISNIVLMGMGEPLYNYDNVAKALKIIMDEEGISISRRKIILSTSGVTPQIERCAKELRVNLAISLHAVTNKLRNKLIPLNKKYPLEELISVCRDYQKISNSKRITFGYVMLKGINDSIEDAKKLVKLIRGIPSIINLIPFNSWEGCDFTSTEMPNIEAFSKVLTKSGHYAPIRTPRGQDIFAACGQLKSESMRLRKTDNR